MSLFNYEKKTYKTLYLLQPPYEMLLLIYH